MPELPEVETVRRSLEPVIVDRLITSVRGDSFPDVMGPGGLDRADGLLGRRIVALDRRGKYLIGRLDDGSALLIHLRITGQLVLASRNDPPLRFEHLVIGLAGPQDRTGSDEELPVELRFADQRRFGRVLHIEPDAVPRLFGQLGPEPLAPGFTVASLADALRGRRAPVKNVLLDQRRVAGLGNIYVDEALFRAGINPLHPAGLLDDEAVARLHNAIVVVLSEALDRRGTTFSSFRDGYGREGENVGNLRVYGRGRHGLPCPVCGTPLDLIRLAGRSSSYCPSCQPSPVVPVPKRT